MDEARSLTEDDLNEMVQRWMQEFRPLRCWTIRARWATDRELRTPKLFGRIYASIEHDVQTQTATIVVRPPETYKKKKLSDWPMDNVILHELLHCVLAMEEELAVNTLAETVLRLAGMDWHPRLPEPS